jgi:aryl-alcohol dehydrogenase-like predicted oxidoreductase
LSIRRAVEGSLRRLRTDHIDLYQFHHVDRLTPFDEIWQAIEVLVQQGKILYAGSSNFAGYHIAQANEAAARRNLVGLVSEQCLYNLAERRAEMEVIPAARDYGLGIIAWSPLHGGLLAGGRDGQRRNGGRAAALRADPAISRAVDAYEDAVTRRGLNPSEVGLAWLLARPGITGPIIGPRTLSHLESAVRATYLELDADLLAGLDEIFPGPGPTPEAFAW